MIKRVLTPEFTITPQEMANEFCAMDGDSQALFFSEVFKIAKTWEAPFCFQVQAIVDSKLFDENARKIMQTLGEYAEVANG